MKFISETDIDEITEQVQSKEEDRQQFFKVLGEKQPVLLAYLLSEPVQLLTEEEQELLFFIA
ncbi:MAG TPA: hypothetical protein ENJ45_01580, partial [Phaeodactylibacter sp.]|nr:hypothetical protein [Phaeodactylibacter sp.]